MIAPRMTTSDGFIKFRVLMVSPSAAHWRPQENRYQANTVHSCDDVTSSSVSTTSGGGLQVGRWFAPRDGSSIHD